MPWVEKLPSGKYRGVWRDAGGRSRSRAGFTQRAEAMRYAGEQEGRTRTGQAGYVGRSITWGKWCDTWEEMRRVERTSSESDATRIAKWLRPEWGRVPLARITTEDVQTWVNQLAGQMAPASVEKVYGLLRSSLKAAVRYKRLAVSPCVDVELPHVPPADERFLTRGEFDRAVHHLNEPYRTAAVILAGTGLRFGEMAGLHWNRVDFDAMTIDVQEVFDGAVIKPYPKGRRKRTVPMASWVAEAILTRPASDRRGCRVEHGGRRRCTSDLVLRGPLGAPLDARNVLRRHWGPALQRAGLEHARQHDLRHTTASWLIQGGCTLTEVAAILGHSETTVTARYAHLGSTHMAGVRAVLEQGYRESLPLVAPLVPHDHVAVDLAN